MEIKRALNIINAFAAGIDPFTGEIFSAESPLQNPEAVRALFLSAKALERYIDASYPVTDLDNAQYLQQSEEEKSSQNRKKVFHDNAGKPWSDSEDIKLIKAFDAGATDKELSSSHQRTVAAVNARLAKLGKIPPVHYQFLRKK